MAEAKADDCSKKDESLWIVVCFEIPRATRDEFAKYMQDNMMKPSRAEEGCLHYHFHKGLEDSAEAPDSEIAKLYLIEQWKDQAAFDFHVETAHLKQYVVDLKRMGVKDIVTKMGGQIF